MGLLSPNPVHRKLTRESRHVIRSLMRVGPAGRIRANVLHAHAAVLDHNVNRLHRPRTAVPTDTAPHRDGLRVRLGARVRGLLRQLRDTKNVRAQQALVREIRHDVARRIAAAERWQRVREAAARGARETGARVARGTSRAWAWVRRTAAGARTAWAGRAHVRTFRAGRPVTRARNGFGSLPSRDPAAARARRTRRGRAARARQPRVRA